MLIIAEYNLIFEFFIHIFLRFIYIIVAIVICCLLYNIQLCQSAIGPHPHTFSCGYTFVSFLHFALTVNILVYVSSRMWAHCLIFKFAKKFKSLTELLSVIPLSQQFQSCTTRGFTSQDTMWHLFSAFQLAAICLLRGMFSFFGINGELLMMVRDGANTLAAVRDNSHASKVYLHHYPALQPG